MDGPNPLWLAEGLSEVMPFPAGMRVLDLGCGKAASSIFLAKEFGATVWAADLWVTPSENFRRIEGAGVAERVLPIHAEAHSLPFAENYFDAIVSFDNRRCKDFAWMPATQQIVVSPPPSARAAIRLRSRYQKDPVKD